MHDLVGILCGYERLGGRPYRASWLWVGGLLKFLRSGPICFQICYLFYCFLANLGEWTTLSLPVAFGVSGRSGLSGWMAALWEAFYIENKRFDLDTLRVPNRSPTPISKSKDFPRTVRGYLGGPGPPFLADLVGSRGPGLF